VVREQVEDRLKHSVETSVNIIMSRKQVIHELELEDTIMSHIGEALKSPGLYGIIIMNKKQEQVTVIQMSTRTVSITIYCEDIVKLESVDEATTVVAGILQGVITELSHIDKYLLSRIMDIVTNALFRTEYEYIYPKKIPEIDMIRDTTSYEAKIHGPIFKIYYDIEYLIDKEEDKMTVVLEHYTMKDEGHIVIDHHMRKVAEAEYRIEDGEIDIRWVSTTRDEDLLKILLDVSKSAETTLYRIADMFLSEKIVEHNGYMIQTYI